jgi:hypothetical protein
MGIGGVASTRDERTTTIGVNSLLVSRGDSANFVAVVFREPKLAVRCWDGRV